MPGNPYEPPRIPSDAATRTRHARGLWATALWTVAFCALLVLIAPSIGVPQVTEVAIFAAVYLGISWGTYRVFSRPSKETDLT